MSINARKVLITLLILLSLLIIGFYVYGKLTENAAINNIISDVYRLCNENKLIIEQSEYGLQINHNIKITDELKLKYGIKGKALLLDVSTVGKNGEVIIEHKTPLIINYNFEDKKFLIDKEKVIELIYANIVVEDYKMEFFKHMKMELNGEYSVKYINSGNHLSSITLVNGDESFIIRYDLYYNKSGVCEAKRIIKQKEKI